jgi:hypothetical protein
LLIGLGLVNNDLGLGLPDMAVGHGEIGGGLVHEGLVIPGINFQQHVPRLDVLVVLGKHLHDRAGNAGTDKGDVAFNKGVVRRFVGRDETDVVEDGGGRGQGDQDARGNTAQVSPARRRHRSNLRDGRTQGGAGLIGWDLFFHQPQRFTVSPPIRQALVVPKFEIFLVRSSAFTRFRTA